MNTAPTLNPGDRLKFVGDPFWWTTRTGDERFTILTRQAQFRPKGEHLYTIIDRTRGVRGPCNQIGNGWAPTMTDQECTWLLASLQNHVAQADRREPAALLQDVGHEMGSWHPRSTQVSFRNNLPIAIDTISRVFVSGAAEE